MENYFCNNNVLISMIYYVNQSFKIEQISTPADGSKEISQRVGGAKKEGKSSIEAAVCKNHQLWYV